MRNEMAPRFQQYVIQQRPTSFVYGQPVVVGTVLPQEGVTYYEVPAEYGGSDVCESHRGYWAAVPAASPLPLDHPDGEPTLQSTAQVSL